MLCPLSTELVKMLDSVIENLEPIATVEIGGWIPFAFLSTRTLGDIRESLAQINCDPESVLKDCARTEDD